MVKIKVNAQLEMFSMVNEWPLIFTVTSVKAKQNFNNNIEGKGTVLLILPWIATSKRFVSFHAGPA